MTKFAAYDATSIYAVAETADEAIAKARSDANDATAQFSAAPIADTLAEWIEENGWDGRTRCFAYDTAGFLVDTTDA